MCALAVLRTASAVTAAGFAWPTLGLRTSTTEKAFSGSAMRAHPRNTTLASSSSSLRELQGTVEAHGSGCTSQRMQRAAN